MALNPSGPISLGGSTVGQSINLELGNAATATASINSAPFRTLAGVATGQISLSNFYGKSNVPPTFFASSSTVNAASIKICFASSGNVYTLQYMTASSRIAVTKLNSAGVEQWTQTLGLGFSAYPSNGNNCDVNEDSSGNVYVALNYYFFKFNSSGTNIFQKEFTVSNVYGGTTKPGLKIDSSGNLYAVATTGTSGAGPIGSAITKYDSTGTVAWSLQITPNTSSVYGTSQPLAPQVDSSGNVYIAQYGYAPPLYTYLYKLNSSGTVLAASVSANGVPTAFAVTADGSMGVILSSSQVVYLNSSFVVQWQKSISPLSVADSVTLGPSNGIIVQTRGTGTTGYAYQNGFVSFNSSGTINFSSFLSAPSAQPFDQLSIIGDGASSLGFYPRDNNLYTQTQYGYYALRIKNDGSQLYSYYINSPLSPLSIITGALSSTASNTSNTFSSLAYTQGASTAGIGSSSLTIGSSSLSLTNLSLDSLTGGQAAYTYVGTYSWICPAGVTSVSAVAVGGGSGGGNNRFVGAGNGGGLGYVNNYSVTAGNSYTVTVGSGGYPTTYGPAGAGGDSSFSSPSVVKGGGGQTASGGNYVGTGGGVGGTCYGTSWGGGGAGGYGGAGGNGGLPGTAGSSGTNGSAGGGAGSQQIGANDYGAYGGGGVSLLGQGNNGQGGGYGNNTYTGGSGGGSNPVNLIGGNFGGSGWSGGTFISGACCCTSYNAGGPGRDGAVRIIWPGSTRTFPSTNTQTP